MSRKGRKEKKEKKKVEKASKVAAKAQAKPKKKSKTTDKWKKKAWYTIIAPEEFERRELGETIAEKPETLIGRLITVTARELANQPKKQHIQLKFKVIDVKANKAITEVVGHEIKESYLKRIVRRRSSKIMTVQNYTSKDGKTYKIKVVIITEKKASHNQRTSIRKTTGNFISKIISGFPSNKVVDELVFGTIPNKLYSELKQIVPVKRIELVKSKLVNA